jgi:hypothetical protein
MEFNIELENIRANFRKTDRSEVNRVGLISLLLYLLVIRKRIKTLCEEEKDISRI